MSHDPALATVPDRVAGAVEAAGLALEHAGEQWRLQAELAELAELRLRVLAAGDEERRRLERDLHDGAQQRLIGLIIALQSSREAAPELADQALAEVGSALAELREIAHGIHPVSLTDAGLAAALRELAEDARVPLELVALPARRLTPEVEAAAYHLLADLVRQAESGPDSLVTVGVTVDDGQLRTEVRVDGADPARYTEALRTSAERIEALGGRLVIGEGLSIELGLPCGS